MKVPNELVSSVMDTHSTLRVPARLAPCIFFIGWIMAGYLEIWQLPFASTWILLLLVPILIYLIRPGNRSAAVTGIMTMGFTGSVLIGYLYQLTDPEVILPGPLTFLGTGLMILTGMIMGYWLLQPAANSSSLNA